MGEFWQQLKDLLNTTAIRLDSDVTVGQIVILVVFVGLSFVVAGFARRWLKRIFNRLRISENTANQRIFNRLRMSENTANRLIAILFIIIIIIGTGLSFNVAGISTGLFGRILNYPITELFQPTEKSTESTTGIASLFQSILGRKPQVVDESTRRLTLAGLFYGFAIIFGMLVLSKYAQYVLRQQVLQAFQIARHTQFVILRVFHFILIIIGVLITLSTLGISLTSIALIFGGLSIGIGFGLQNTVANLISGFILIFEKPVKIGDLVEIIEVNIFGRVTSINLRSTVIMSLDEKEIIVPNSQLITEPIHNLTHYTERFRIRVLVGVSYGSDVQLVKKVMLEAANEHPDVIKEPSPNMEYVTAPFVRFINFGESSLDFELLAWIPDSFLRFDVASDLHFTIWDKFKENNIRIPFPQRDVHFYPKEQE